MIIAALIFLGLLGSTALAGGNDSKKESKKKKKKRSDDLEGLMSGNTYSWMKHWENPDTGDYIKHWIDIDIK